MLEQSEGKNGEHFVLACQVRDRKILLEKKVIGSS
jgi:hypothetical protein